MKVPKDAFLSAEEATRVFQTLAKVWVQNSISAPPMAYTESDPPSRGAAIKRFFWMGATAFASFIVVVMWVKFFDNKLPPKEYLSGLFIVAISAGWAWYVDVMQRE